MGGYGKSVRMSAMQCAADWSLLVLKLDCNGRQNHASREHFCRYYTVQVLSLFVSQDRLLNPKLHFLDLVAEYLQ
jgi:hypothetical protein